MKYRNILLVTIVGSITFVATGEAHANPFTLENNKLALTEELKPKITTSKKTKTVKKYQVKSGDTLSSIAKEHKTSVKRLFYKNKGISHPDVLKVGQKLIIPTRTEKLKKRSIAGISLDTGSAPKSSHRGAVTGNTYPYGWCTWYAKDRRPDIPNQLGNADAWYEGAAAQGYSVGLTPKAGAVGVAIGYMHVVYIEKVKGNQVYVSEMNYEGFGVVSSRWTSASEFRYIY